MLCIGLHSLERDLERYYLPYFQLEVWNGLKTYDEELTMLFLSILEIKSTYLWENILSPLHHQC